MAGRTCAACHKPTVTRGSGREECPTCSLPNLRKGFTVVWPGGSLTVADADRAERLADRKGGSVRPHSLQTRSWQTHRRVRADLVAEGWTQKVVG